MKTIAISQSNYIPWKGYFDLIASVDEFVLFDAMQFTRRDWRNRNKIKTQHGTQWLSIPVDSKGKYHQAIDETRIQDGAWREKHWQSIRHAYGKTPGFREFARDIEHLFEGADQPLLSQVNRSFIEGLNALLGITTPLRDSREYPLAEGKTERLIAICRQAGATRYISGPAARDYIEPERFAAAGIELAYFDYSGYPEYPQPHGAFEHGVTILDLLFSVGSDFGKYLKYIGQ